MRSRGHSNTRVRQGLRAGLAACLAGATLVWAPVTAHAAPPPDREAAQEQGTNQLEHDTNGKVRVETHAQTGLVRFVGTTRANPIPRAKGVSAAASDEAQARGFLAGYGAMFGVDDQATELRTVDRNGTAVPFQQVHEGVPVMGGEVAVTVDDAGNVLSANGEISADLTVDPNPTLTAAQAQAAATTAVAKQHAGGSVTEAPELWVYDPELLGGPSLGAPRLVWRLTIAADDPVPFRDLVLVDAATGGIALTIDELEESLNRQVCDRNNVVGASESCTSGYVRTEGQAATGNTDVDRAYDYSGDTYNFYQSKFGRDSLDNAGLTLKSTVKFCPSAAECPYENAYWNGAQMVYGAGFAAADDVVGHELTHGVTAFESNLFYYYQSGAINESLSDVFGELIDLGNGSGTDTAATRWQMGEDLPSIGAIRDMENPPAFGDPDRVGSASYSTAATDEGGVHTNSGINNKAAFLMADGGTFNGRTIVGLGTDKTARIYYETASNLITSAADYNDLYDALQQGCNNLVGTAGITAGDCAEVTKVVQATEMNLQPPAAASITEAPVCGAGTSANNLFFDNLENTGSGNWTKTVTSGSQAWAYPQNPNALGFDATYATSGTTSMFGADLTTTSNTAIARTADVVPPAGKTTYLRFRHAFGLENTYDGGRVEYSTTNGSSWVDAASLFTENGYNGTSQAIGGSAFSGVSHGYYSSRLNLTSLAGQNVRFRFRLATDSSVGVYGWWIDDVQVYTCDAAASAPGAPTIGTATAGNAQATVTWTAPASDGGSAITGYVVTPYIGASAQSAQTFNSTATSQAVTGLTNGTAYTFKVAAKNAVGTGAQSAASNSVTPAVPVTPGAPTIGTATAGNGQAALTWSAPASDGGSAITGYVVTPYIGASAQTAQTFNSTATAQTVTGLTNGTAYTFKVAAINAVGTGAQSAASNSATPSAVTAPGAPTIGNAVAGNTTVSLSWAAPASNGGSAVTGYVVTPYIGAAAQSDRVFNTTGTTQSITGLANGTTYTFKVAAKNAVGTGAQSGASNAVTAGTPAPPGFQSAQPGNGQAKVGWFPPSNNGSAITGYVITPYIGAAAQAPQTFNTTASSDFVIGLTNGTTYTFKVAAINANGTGAEATTAPIVVGAPAGPAFPRAIPGTTTIRVAWAEAVNNGAAVQGYIVTPYQGSTPMAPVTFNSTAITQTLSGFTSGVSYSFKVAAFNSRGTGPQTQTDVVIEGTPAQPGFQNVSAGNASAEVRYLVPPANSAPLISYTVWPVQGSTVLAPQVFNTPAATLLNVTGLTNGVTYTFRVAASNSVGTGPYATTNAVLVGAPASPGFPSAAPGDTVARVNWGNGSDNGSPITSHIVTPYIGSVAQPSQSFAPGAERVVTGLTNGVSYTFRVVNVNAVGPSIESVTAQPVVVGSPTTPVFPSAKPLNASAKVAWGTPTANAAPITGYVVTPMNGTTALAPQTFNSTATSQTITGLANGTTYTFRVAAINSLGTGPYAVTGSVKVGTPTAPAKPSVVAGAGSITLSWVAPADNGSPITGYIVNVVKNSVAQPDLTFDASTTTRIISGLTPGASYWFSITAVNAVGNSTWSPASNTAVPT